MDSNTMRAIINKLTELEPHVFIAGFSPPSQVFHRVCMKEDIPGDPYDVFPYEITGGYEKYFDEITNKILNSNDQWKNTFSEYFIQNSIILLLRKLKSDGNNDNVSQYFGELIEKLDNFAYENKVLIPLLGIRLEEDYYELGNIILRKFGKEQYKELEEQLGITDRKPNEKIVPYDIMRDRFNVYAEFKSVSDSIKIIEKALEEIHRVLDILRFSIPYLFSEHFYEGIIFPGHTKQIYQEWVNMNAGLPGEIIEDGISIITHFYGSYSTQYLNVGHLFDLDISKETIKKFEKLGVFKLLNLVKRGSLNEFEKTLLRGIHWFSNAFVHNRVEDKFLNLIICLETFLTPDQKDQEPITASIAEGVALLTEDTLVKRKSTRKRIKEFYGKRCALSHRGSGKIEPAEYRELLSITKRFILIMMSKLESFNTKEDLRNYIEDIKLRP